MPPSAPDLQSVLLRVEKLERQNRILKRLGYIPLIVLGSGLLLAQASRQSPPASSRPSKVSYQTLVVHRLELRDKAGKLRGLWTADELVLSAPAVGDVDAEA